MVVFLFSTHTLWPHHAETELEILQDHLAKGDTVYRFVCNGELPVCDTNVPHRMHPCLRCVDKQKIGQKLLVGSEKVITKSIYTSEFVKKARQIEFNYTDLAAFKLVKIENYDIGYAVSSSIISELRDPEPGILNNLDMFQNYFFSSLAIYYATQERISSLKPDLIYAFNGRVAHAKPVLRAAQQAGVECRIHERGCDIFHYGITVNTTPHDISNFTIQLERKWNEADVNEREKIGAAFYEERLHGKEQAWFSFVKDQQQNLLPTDWNPNKQNIAIFNTSEDEYESIGPEWKNELYENQAVGLEKILIDFESNDAFHFYLRIHPNLKGLNNRQIRDAYALKKYSNLTIIDSESPVSTYTLMMHCNKTITFGSSTGIEAVYWGKVSILLGKSFYCNLEAAYSPASHAETLALIKAELKPKPRTDALKYGYYLKTFGHKYLYYKPTGFLSGTFKNVDLDTVSSFKTRVFMKLYNIGLLDKIYQWTRRSGNFLQKAFMKW